MNNKAVKQKTDQEPARFNKETLIEAYGTLGASREVVIGALYDMKKPSTMDEAKERVTAFLARPIK